ncbi:MAG: iron-sulfur cluster assembly accessory protein [Candidatus Cloacimonadota bacterium]|nr:MAG: iron-sulfur cluster assembly accessory protein [Candidatus Cloacimonadota bacterium]PCJ20127.1 MAG: iron-sulfur cluster assembly accessory protein [Candidatus Cloacimonadota bacterium]
MVSLTDKAVLQVEKIFSENGDPEAVLHVGLRDGGCAGMSYTMDLVTNVEEPFTTIEYSTFKVVSQEKDLKFIDGLVLDYNDSILNSGFNFSNPKAKETCGCGSSFSV